MQREETTGLNASKGAKRRPKGVTISEVAEKAHVSVATVSRVLNSSGPVKPEVQKAVLEAVQTLGYEQKVGGGPRKPEPKSKRIAVVLPNVVNPYFALLIKGILGAGQVRDAEVLIFDSDENEGLEQQHFQKIAESNVAGVIYIPFARTLNLLVETLIEHRFPLVFLDRSQEQSRHRDEICTVASDNVEGAYQAATYLLNLGHRDIVYVTHSPHLSTSVARFEGFRKGMSEFGLGVDGDLVVMGDTTFEGGYQVIQKMLRAGRRFTAVFSSNDMMAFGAWEAAKEFGLRVPQDLSIIGYDEIPFSAYLSLTTIAQPSFEIGQNALSLVMDLIEGRRVAPQSILLRDSLIIRKSCLKI